MLHFSGILRTFFFWNSAGIWLPNSAEFRKYGIPYVWNSVSTESRMYGIRGIPYIQNSLFHGIPYIYGIPPEFFFYGKMDTLFKLFLFTLQLIDMSILFICFYLWKAAIGCSDVAIRYFSSTVESSDFSDPFPTT